MGSIWMCFHECTARLHLDALQEDYQREASYDWRKIVLNINMISIALGAILFFAQIHLPEILNNTLSSVGDMIGPASMIVAGMLFAEWVSRKFSEINAYILFHL